MRSCEKRYLDCEMAIPTILSFAESRLEIVQGQVGDGAFQIVEIHSETQADKLQPLRRLWCRFRAGCRVVHGMNWSSSSQSASQLKENPTGPGWSLGLRSRRGHHVRGVIEIRAVDLCRLEQLGRQTRWILHALEEQELCEGNILGTSH